MRLFLVYSLPLLATGMSLVAARAAFAEKRTFTLRCLHAAIVAMAVWAGAVSLGVDALQWAYSK